MKRDTTTGERRWLVSEGDAVSSRVSRLRKSLLVPDLSVTSKFCLEVVDLTRRLGELSCAVEDQELAPADRVRGLELIESAQEKLFECVRDYREGL